MQQLERDLFDSRLDHHRKRWLRRLRIAPALVASAALHTCVLWLLTELIDSPKPSASSFTHDAMQVEIIGNLPSRIASLPALQTGSSDLHPVTVTPKKPEAALTAKFPEMLDGGQGGAPTQSLPKHPITEGSDSESASFKPPEQNQNQPTVADVYNMPTFPTVGRQNKSVVDLVNEQLHTEGRRDKLSEGIQGASVPDCLKSNPGVGLLAIPLLIYMASEGKCR